MRGIAITCGTIFSLVCNLVLPIAASCHRAANRYEAWTCQGRGKNGIEFPEIPFPARLPVELHNQHMDREKREEKGGMKEEEEEESTKSRPRS